jgi:DNA-binding response OmpR family regulator
MKVAIYENDPALEALLEDIVSIEQLDVVRCTTLAEIHGAVDSGDIAMLWSQILGGLGTDFLATLNAPRSWPSGVAFRCF